MHFEFVLQFGAQGLSRFVWCTWLFCCSLMHIGGFVPVWCTLIFVLHFCGNWLSRGVWCTCQFLLQFSVNPNLCRSLVRITIFVTVWCTSESNRPAESSEQGDKPTFFKRCFVHVLLDRLFVACECDWVYSLNRSTDKRPWFNIALEDCYIRYDF